MFNKNTISLCHNTIANKSITQEAIVHWQKVMNQRRKTKKWLEKSPSPGTFKQAMNFFVTMIHLWDGSHSLIRGSCKKSVICEEFVVLLSLSFGCCTGSSLLVLVPSVELSFLLFSAVSFLDPPSSCNLGSLLGFVPSCCPIFMTSACAMVLSSFVSAGRTSTLSWIQKETMYR